MAAIARRRYGGPHIDPHVHCRDWSQARTATIKEVMSMARSLGIVAICDMPNTNPPIVSSSLVESRLVTAASQNATKGYYLYIGATGEADQLREAMRVATDHPKVVGIKLYAGKSTGDLAVINYKAQRLVYQIAHQEGYKGLIAVHCEDEHFACPDEWKPEFPMTWNRAKPPKMEINGVLRQITFALEENFEGHLHISHISTPESVFHVNAAKGNGMRISCGITPHHLLFSTDDMTKADGMALKVNPPIRDKISADLLMQLTLEGKIDWIETDHAPHPKDTKTFAPGKDRGLYMSGIPGLELYTRLLDCLRTNGASECLIERMTWSNIKKAYPKIVESA